MFRRLPRRARKVLTVLGVLMVILGGIAAFTGCQSGASEEKRGEDLEFNAKTADQGDMIIPVVITVYADRSFSFITKTPPAAVLLKKAAKIKSGSATPNKTKVATLTRAEVQKIAELKMPDLNAASIEAATSMIAGTARSMGITVTD